MCGSSVQIPIGCCIPQVQRQSVFFISFQIPHGRNWASSKHWLPTPEMRWTFWASTGLAAGVVLAGLTRNAGSKFVRCARNNLHWKRDRLMIGLITYTLYVCSNRYCFEFFHYQLTKLLQVLLAASWQQRDASPEYSWTSRFRYHTPLTDIQALDLHTQTLMSNRCSLYGFENINCTSFSRCWGHETELSDNASSDIVMTWSFFFFLTGTIFYLSAFMHSFIHSPLSTQG